MEGRGADAVGRSLNSWEKRRPVRIPGRRFPNRLARIAALQAAKGHRSQKRERGKRHAIGGLSCKTSQLSEIQRNQSR